MPKVPTLESQQVSAAPLNLPGINVRTSADAQGGAIGQGLSRLGHAVFQREIQMKREDDANKGMEAFVQFSDGLREIERGENGVFTRRGRDALGILDETDDRLETISEKISLGLENDAQRQAFKALVLRRREASLNAVSRHEAAQRQVFQDETTQAVIADSINIAVDNFNDPFSIEAAKIAGHISIFENAEGKSGEVIDKQLMAFDTALNKEVLGRLIVDDPQGAKIYYDENKDEIDPKERSAIEISLKNAVNRGKAQAMADEIMAKGNSIKENLDDARKITDPLLRDETVRRIKVRDSETKNIQQQEKIETSQNAWKALEDGFSANQSTDNLMKLIDATPDAATRHAMNAWLAKKSRGVDIQTDQVEYYRLRRMAMDDPEKFKKINLVQFFHVLADKEKETLIDIQGKVTASGDTEGRTLNQLVTQSLRKIDIDTGAGGSKKDKGKTALFWRFVEDEIALLEKQTGKKSTRSDWQAIIDRGLIEGEIPGGTFSLSDPDVRLFEAKPDQRFFIDDVPDEERPKIIDALKRHGLPVTNEAIIDLFTKKKVRR